MKFKATDFIRESPAWYDLGTYRKVVFKKGKYRGLTIYTREQCQRREDSDWSVKLIEYSLDKENWTEEWIKLLREVKKMGK